MYPRILKKAFTWAQLHGYCGVEFMEEGEHTWVFLRCWDNSQFRRVCVAVLDRFSGNVSEEVVALGRIIDAIGPDVHVVSVQGGPHALVEAYVNFLGSGYQQKLIEYPLFDLRLFKRCLQKTASSVLELWTRPPWRSLSWIGWRGRRVATGWLLDLRWRRSS